MSDSAQLALTVVCYVVAVCAQLAGLALVVKEVRRTSRALRRWQAASTEGRGLDASVRGGELSLIVDDLLGDRFDRAGAVVLVGIGVVAGALGHFLSL